MYTLSRINRYPMVRRQPTYWQMTEDFFRPFVEMVNSPMRTNVKETDTAYLFEAELPGYEPDEIDLSVQDGVMTISAEHKETEEKDGETVTTASRSVRRSFTIEGIDDGNIVAEYKNGVLGVTLPKMPEPEAPEARKIPIGGGN